MDNSQANKSDLSNGGMELKNCSCFHLPINNYKYNNQNYPPPSPTLSSTKYRINPSQSFLHNSSSFICACYLLEKYSLIDEIICYLIKICSYFSINKLYDFTDILPLNDSIYKYYSSEYVKNPHLYYHYIETLKGFIVVIINKSKFNWNCNSIIEYNIEKKEYYAYFNFGRFKINYDLMIYDFDYKFKNILTKFNYHDSYLYLRQSTTIIEKLKSPNIKINVSNANNINYVKSTSSNINEENEIAYKPFVNKYIIIKIFKHFLKHLNILILQILNIIIMLKNYLIIC